MSTIDAARATWRAELCEYSSASLRAAGFESMADDQQRIADYHRNYAALMEELAEAKANGDEDALKQTKLRVLAFRQASRSDGAAQPGVLSNFSEPSNEQLLEQLKNGA